MLEEVGMVGNALHSQCPSPHVSSNTALGVGQVASWLSLTRSSWERHGGTERLFSHSEGHGVYLTLLKTLS